MRSIYNYFIGKFRTTKNTEVIVFDKGGYVGSLGLSKKLFRKYVEAGRKLDKNQPLTASEKTHLFGYLNPYYRFAYNVSKRRK